MTLERIERASDPRLDAYRDLRDADLLRERGLFVAEGRLVVRRVIEEGRFAIESLLLNDAAWRALDPTIARVDPATPVYLCPTDTFPAVIGFNLHRGALALVRRPPGLAVDTLLGASRMLLVLGGVGNPDNVGGIMRNAAAFSADGVLLAPTSCDPLYRKAIRTSMGAALRVPFAKAEPQDWPSVLARVRAAGFAIVALTPRKPSEALDAFAARPRPQRMALVLGAEGPGLTPAVEDMADHRVRIPISDRVDSLNVTVAAGIVLNRLAAAP